MSSNCKVHFAGYDNDTRAICVLRAGDVRYRLFTAYPFIKDKKTSYKVAEIVENKARFKHVIVDSGLFTLMFGTKRGSTLTEHDMRDWMHRIVAFASENDIHNASFVECDCQKLCGSEAAWRIRREMKDLMPQKEIINVYHLEDGVDGFDRIVEFSDYIAISVPELRIHRPKRYKEMTCTLARRAKQLKPTIKIHLLGCTEKQLLQANRFVTSADSSSWTSSARFGHIKGHHVDTISQDYRKQAYNEVLKQYSLLGFEVPPLTAKRKRCDAANLLSITLAKADYAQWCGSQD